LLVAILFFNFLIFYPEISFASTTNGTIDTTSKYAWGENTGWVDFGSTAGNVQITDSALSGSAYGENIGWILLDAVTNTSSGALSGYGWGENVGWVDFSGVTIGTDGVFSGSAYGENIGWITFGTGNNKVLTDWRPSSARTVEASVSTGRSSSGSRSNRSNLAVTPTSTIWWNPFTWFNSPLLIKPATPKPVVAKPLIPTSPIVSSLPVIQLSARSQNLELLKPLTVKADGSTNQKLTLLPNTKVELTVKPDHPAKEIVGYLVLDSKLATKEQKKKNLQLASLAALDLPKKEIENRLVVDRFNYLDPNRDGLYTATFTSPVVAGIYEVITVITYERIDLGKKELRLTTVVDPEGYVYAVIGNTEVRLPQATVSLWWFNPATKKYQLWPATQFKQLNPQVTDQRGTYSFLVPAGKYYLTITASGYGKVTGPVQEVMATEGVHTNFRLKPTIWQRFWLMWQSLVS